MPRRDARSLPAAAQQEKRRVAIRLRQEDHAFADTGEIVGVYWATVHGWWKRFEAGGIEALAAQTRGRRLGAQRRLTARQEQTIQRLVADQTPEQLRMPVARWTRAAIGELIRARYGVRLPVRTIWHYLKRWGFTPQKPLQRAYEQHPETITRWLEHEYPAIAARVPARTKPELTKAARSHLRTLQRRPARSSYRASLRAVARPRTIRYDAG